MSKLKNAFQNGDLQIFYFINGRVKCRVLDKIMPIVTRLGNAGTTLAICFALIIFGDDYIRRAGIDALISLVTSHLLVHILKKKVGRERPSHVVPNTHTFDVPLDYYSFPSGHTTAVFSVGASLSLYFPHLSLPLMLIAALVGISRLYLGVHYPSDVLIGMLIGVLFSYVTHHFVGRVLPGLIL